MISQVCQMSAGGIWPSCAHSRQCRRSDLRWRLLSPAISTRRTSGSSWSSASASSVFAIGGLALAEDRAVGEAPLAHVLEEPVDRFERRLLVVLGVEQTPALDRVAV